MPTQILGHSHRRWRRLTRALWSGEGFSMAQQRRRKRRPSKPRERERNQIGRRARRLTRRTLAGIGAAVGAALVAGITALVTSGGQHVIGAVRGLPDPLKLTAEPEDPCAHGGWVFQQTPQALP